MILSGMSRCGKTVLAWNMIAKDILGTDRLIIMCKARNQILFEQLDKLCESSPELAEKINIFDELKDIDELNIDPEERTTVFIDDFIENKDDPKLQAWFFRSRHKNADVLFTTQAFYNVPPAYRRNSNMIALFKGSCDHRDSRKKVWRDHFSDVPFDLFDKWYCKYVMNQGAVGKQREAHNFLLIDQETVDKMCKYRLNLDEYLAVPMENDFGPDNDDNPEDDMECNEIKNGEEESPKKRKYPQMHKKQKLSFIN